MLKKVIFMGTPEISVRVLEALLSLENAEVVGVVSQPDRETNRKKQIVFSPIKSFCLEHNLNLYQPEKIGLIYDELKELAPDLIITCAYGQFIPQKILDLPNIGCYNLHASLLPKLRGGAPIHWSIINGDTTTGITLMEMILKMDAGDIVAQESCPIEPHDTTYSLTKKLAQVAHNVLIANWNNLINKSYKSVHQDDSKVTFGYNISKPETIINFNQPCKMVDCFIRGLFDKPIAQWNYQNTLIKVYEAEVTNIKSSLLPGTISRFDETGLYLATQDYDLKLNRIQLPNKNIKKTCDLYHGHNYFRTGTS